MLVALPNYKCNISSVTHKATLMSRPYDERTVHQLVHTPYLFASSSFLAYTSIYHIEAALFTSLILALTTSSTLAGQPSPWEYMIIFPLQGAEAGAGHDHLPVQLSLYSINLCIHTHR
jgi:hypothetical protein